MKETKKAELKKAEPKKGAKKPTSKVTKAAPKASPQAKAIAAKAVKAKISKCKAIFTHAEKECNAQMATDLKKKVAKASEAKYHTTVKGAHTKCIAAAHKTESACEKKGSGASLLAMGAATYFAAAMLF